MKVLIMTARARVERFYDLSTLPKDWELVFAGSFPTPEAVRALGADADFVFADAVSSIGAELMDAMPRLKLIHSEGVGYNGIDIEAAARRGIYVCNHAAANSGAVAEHAILLMLALQRRVLEGDAMVRAGEQMRAKERFILDEIPELGSCGVGLVGFGAIGRETAKRLRGFGCAVYYCNRRKAPAEAEADCGAAYLDFDALLGACDIVSLHLPANAETAGIIGRDALTRFKPGALLINTARGELVDQEALAEALAQGRLGGAGLDTLSPEPVRADNPLLRLPDACRYKVLFSPHIGGTTKQCFTRTHRDVWRNLLDAAAGRKPRNIVNDWA
jgi:lactate dehydrogenase-like 2-hydroxyacid dehydrogenase